MSKNDSYAGQLIDEIKALKEENEKLKENYEIVRRNLAKSREDYKERTTEVLKLERRIQKLEEHPYNSYALRLIKEIEKMKCCENCKEYSETYRTCCRDTHYEMCVDRSKWEMKG